MSLINESTKKSELGLTDDKLEKIYRAYSDGIMTDAQKEEFERDFPDYIQKMKDYRDNLSGPQLVSENDAPSLSQNKPRVESFLNSYDLGKLSKIEDAYQSGQNDT